MIVHVEMAPKGYFETVPAMVGMSDEESHQYNTGLLDPGRVYPIAENIRMAVFCLSSACPAGGVH